MRQLPQFLRYLTGLLLQILAAILVGALLLTGVRMLPAAPIERNLVRSAPVFAEEGVYPALFSWCTSQLDSTTDAHILMICACDTGENPLIQAMRGSWNKVSSRDAISEQLSAHYGEGIPFDGTEPYYQYWHGYQLVIRPLLCLTDYTGIRILNGIVQTGLLALLCIVLYRKKLGRCILPYLASVAMLLPPALAMSLQFSSCYYIMTISSLILLLKQDSLDRLDGYLFLYTGIATAYFDFLTYPVVTLGIPAAFYFYIRRNTEIRDTFCRGVKLCFSWAVGYAGMWTGKWLLGSLILRQNLLTVASAKLMERSLPGSEGHSLVYSIRSALSANARSFLTTPATLMVGVLVLVLLILLVKKITAGTVRLSSIGKIFFPFVILALVPVAWYVITAQHAFIHHWFTNKAFCVSVFAGLAGLAKANQRTA